MDSGYSTVSSFSGFVYQDKDNDGVFDAGEVPIKGALITLTGTDFNNVPVTMTAHSGVDGSYHFNNLLAGNYTVKESQPAGFVDGTDTPGTPVLVGLVSSNDAFSSFSLPAGTNAVDYNFGERDRPVPASLAGYVYFDRNNNGKRNTGDYGIAGVVVRLTGVDDLGQKHAKDGGHEREGALTSSASCGLGSTH